MKRIPLIIAAVAVACALNAVTARAQFGAGIGLAAIGDNVNQAGGELADLFHKDSIGLGDVSGNLGFYVTGRARFEVGPVRLLGDLSYVYFQKQEIELTSASAGTDNSGSATFEVGTSMIPIGVGATFALPVPVVKPYLGAELTYTVVKRTYTFVSGSQEMQTIGIESKDAGDPETGMSINAGVEFDVAVATLDVGLKYNMMNAFSTDDNEKSMRYLQVGASLIF